VNDFLQTSNPSIYAIGSVCSKYISLQITEIMANIAISNAFSPFNIKRFSSACVPYYIQTTPEIARTGVLPSIAKELGIEIDTYVENFSNLEGAMIQGNRVGFVKIICKKGTDEIMGAVIVGDKPNDMISTMSLALHQKISLSKLSQIFHAYPTLSKAIQNCAILCEEKLRSSSRFSFIYKYFAF
jgi:pyruvate/2-oxoglutarate dehydrogenase complex dihydrolipoamide dehydrogenase (E3) component